MKATSDIGSVLPPKPPVPPAHKTEESEGPGRHRRLFPFILRNLSYLQEVGVLLGIGAGGVCFFLNLMVNSKLEGVEAKLEKTNTKLEKLLDNLDTKIDKFESRLDARMDKVDAKLDKLDAKLNTLIGCQRRKDIAAVGTSVLISILATSFLKVSVK